MAMEPRVIVDPPRPETTSSEERDALAIIRATLDRYGLGSLVGWAWEQILTGSSNIEILSNLRQRTEYQDRFKIMEQRRKAGLRAYSEEEWIQYEENVRQVMRRWNLPAGFYDEPDDFIAFGLADKSAAELNAQIQEAHDSTVLERGAAREKFVEWYGVEPDDGTVLAYVLDAKRGLSLVERQLRAASIGGGARNAGLQIGRERAEELAAQGVTRTQAQEGFSRVAAELEAEQFQAGASSPRLSQEELEDEAFEGDARVTQRRQRRAREAAGAFETGGGAAATGRGVIGAGTIQR